MEFSFVTTAARAEREAEDDRIAKLFVGTLPKGAALTFLQRSEGGYQVRVQCADDEMIYAVVVNANASGHFNNIAIKSKTRDQWNQTTANIRLSPR